MFTAAKLANRLNLFTVGIFTGVVKEDESILRGSPGALDFSNEPCLPIHGMCSHRLIQNPV